MLNPQHLIESGGLLLITAIIFAESGMLLGFFLPGDTLLLTAGIFAAQGKLSLAAIIVLVSLAAIAGDNVGYTIGKHAGKKLFRKKDSLFFRQEYIERSEKFYERYGAKAMLVSHFVVVVRTFAPVVAGISKMPRHRFIFFDAIGDIAWAVSVTLIGYWFGSKIPNVDHYILLAVLLATLVSFGPMIYHLGKILLERRKAINKPPSGDTA
jgi:membrane-associated protein